MARRQQGRKGSRTETGWKAQIGFSWTGKRASEDEEGKERRTRAGIASLLVDLLGPSVAQGSSFGCLVVSLGDSERVPLLCWAGAVGHAAAFHWSLARHGAGSNGFEGLRLAPCSPETG